MSSRVFPLLSLGGLLLLALLAASCPGALAAELVVERERGVTRLLLPGEPPFHTTSAEVLETASFSFSSGRERVATWTERDDEGRERPFYALGLDGRPLGRARATSYRLALAAGSFEPLAGPSPAPPAHLALPAEARLYLVQFVTQPIGAYREALSRLGAKIRHFVPHHALVVEAGPRARAALARLDFVRWVGPYHPHYRLEAPLRADRETLERLFPRERYNLLFFASTAAQRADVAARIEDLGGVVDRLRAGKLLMEATLTPAQLLEVAGWDEIAYVDRYSPLERDMDIVRQLGGADHVESVAGFTGAGVRGEVYDVGFDIDHPDLVSRPPLEHGGPVGIDTHGAACSGILFGDGSGDPSARGLLPDGQAILADAYVVDLVGSERYTHTGELLEPPYEAVFQSSSVGSARTTEYTSISAEHDAMLFDWDLLHCQSQSNAGSQESRPQAWAKNVVSGGGIMHFDTADKSDDCWSCGLASIGPAADGRVKPDLSFFYDRIYTTQSITGGYGEFSGTSATTPSICGHFGLFFEMWAAGHFGNEVVPGASVFAARPHMTTAKAALINTAEQYPFSGLDHDLTRMHQGWGIPSVERLHALRGKISFVDESVVLANTQSATFNVWVEAGEPTLKATLTWADPAGNPAAAMHRINDLSLRVVSPEGIVYWGNHGLLEGNWSAPEGNPDTIDTVENVFVATPSPGLWLVEVHASELIEDGHVETPALDADFALVVSGARIEACRDEGEIKLERVAYSCSDEALVRVVDCGPNLDPSSIDELVVTLESDTEPGGESLTLTESAPDSATFTATMALAPDDAPGTLHVSEGDLVVARYVDADDGKGGSDIPRSTSAEVDCAAPLITELREESVMGRQATIAFSTDEAARGEVAYGLTCQALDLRERGDHFVEAHRLVLRGLEEGTTYRYAALARDRADNLARDDAGGACHELTTQALPETFTERFSDDNDLDFFRLLFTPLSGIDPYESCGDAAGAFETDPAGGALLDLPDDGSVEVILSGGEQVSFYGVSYDRFHVGSNGYLTFGEGDRSYDESLERHFSLPRFAALFDDLNPSAGGEVSWKQEADRVAVTFEGVPELGASTGNSFQFELFFDGRIAITFLEIAAKDGLAGLSEGAGVPPEFQESDLGAQPSCSAVALTPGEAGASEPLLVTDYERASGAMTLSFGVPCEASGHVIEYGPLTRESLESYAWSGQECGVDTSGTHVWQTAGLPNESLFFVVVANDGAVEGSYGRASEGTERSEDTTSTSCPFEQELVNACD